MDLRRMTGNALIAIGALNLLNFYAPRPIPTFGPSAFIFGALFIGAGIALKRKRSDNLFGNGGNGFFGRSRQNTNGRRMISDPLLAVRVLRLASESRGMLTVAQTAMELNVPLDEAEAALVECAAKGGATIEVDARSGVVSYRFAEFLPEED